MRANPQELAFGPNAVQIVLAGERVVLHPHAALFWEAEQTLIVADLHLGKATHFRRHGMAVPQYVQDETLDKLSGLLLDLEPRRLLILGDLFHADYNAEWEDFADVILGFSAIQVELVPGNHDRLTHHQFEKYGITVRPEPYREGPFVFSHHPLSDEHLVSSFGDPSLQERLPGHQLYNLAGHVHPAVRLKGKGSSLRLPCFLFGEAKGLLPAFGAFTGTHVLAPSRKDRVYVLVGDKVMDVTG